MRLPPHVLGRVPDESLIARLRELPADERAAVFRQVFGDSAVQREQAGTAASGTAKSPSAPEFPSEAISRAFGLALEIAPKETPGTHIGSYRLLEQIGEGGFGVVWMAEQEQPIRRRVALKILKHGTDSREVIARFEAERQALALMDHPNIARVLDAGATETGRPYFVMELVRGVAITRYCDDNRLTPTARLRQFVSVCQAVQHAHQKGIIHRDLKPSNVLMTLRDGVAVPKVIDFGIAKAISGARLTDKTLFTQFFSFLGTPAYTSPEQMEMGGLDVDTRSDIYSLGVLLYELLTGRTPFDPDTLAKAGLEEMRRTIREIDPPRPSLRLGTLSEADRTSVAERRSTDAAKLSGLLRGDLDWIVMRCLEKDRTRRYETANGLAMDVQRYLADEPVLARAPSAGYRLRKLIRRNRLGFLSAGIVSTTVVAALVLSTMALWRERSARALTNSARTQAEGLMSYLIGNLDDEIDRTVPVETLVRLVDEAVKYYDGLPPVLQSRDTERRRALARMRQGVALARVGQLDAGYAASREAIAVFERRLAAEPASEIAAQDLALAIELPVGEAGSMFELDSRPTLARRALEVVRPFATAARASARSRSIYATALAMQAWPQQSFAQGIPYCEEAQRILAGLGALNGSNLIATVDYAGTGLTKALLVFQLGRFDEAERLAGESEQLLEQLLLRRPADLSARHLKCELLALLSLVADRQFRLEDAMRLAEARQRAADDCARFEGATVYVLTRQFWARHNTAALLWKAGQVRAASAKAHEISPIDRDPRADHDYVALEARYWTHGEAARHAVETGDFEGAARDLAEVGRLAGMMMQAGCPWPALLPEFTAAAQRGFESWCDPSAAAFSRATEALRRIGLLPRYQIPWEDTWAALRDGVLCEVMAQGGRLRRFAEIESLFREAQREPLAISDSRAGEFSAIVEPKLWFALALAHKDKPEEARTAVAATLATLRGGWSRGDRSIDTIRGLAFALYVQALTESDDTEGRARRQAELDEAQRALDALTDEAKQLYSWREVIGWVAAARSVSTAVRG